MRELFFIVATIAVLFANPVAMAAEMTTSVGGRLLQIVRSKDSSEEQLLIDGKKIYANYLIVVDEVSKVQGRTLIIGLTSAGGTSCEGSPFIVSFSGKSDARLDGPLNTCMPTTHRKIGTRLVFKTEPPSGKGSESWTWTAAKGFSAVRKISE